MPKPTHQPNSEEGGAHPGDQSKPRPDQAAGSEYADAISGMLEGRHRVVPSPQARGPRPTGKGWHAVVWLMALGLVGWAGWGLYDYYLRPVAPPLPESQRMAGRIMLFNAVRAIEAERQEAGALPRDLSGLVLPRGNFEYVLADTGYSLQLTLPDVLLSHRSGEDVQRLLWDAGVR